MKNHSVLRHFTGPIASFLTRSRKPSKQVAIVVPLSSRSELTPDEEISLRHLEFHLGSYDRFLVAPRGSPLRIPGFRTKEFSRRFFGSAAAHNLLMYSPSFYRTFEDYEYILFYHLDSLVFSDQLKQWCGEGIDYIGPPWINCADTPWIKNPRVGNGGFTLLRVQSALKVLRNRYCCEPSALWLDVFTRNGEKLDPLIVWLEKLQRRFPYSDLIRRTVDECVKMRNPSPHNRNNDVFWSDRAVRYHPEFKVASLEQGLRFGFEASPRTCLELNGGKMPFGCHAWPRYDRSFWTPHLLPFAMSAGGGTHRAEPAVSAEPRRGPLPAVACRTLALLLQFLSG